MAAGAIDGKADPRQNKSDSAVHVDDKQYAQRVKGGLWSVGGGLRSLCWNEPVAHFSHNSSKPSSLCLRLSDSLGHKYMIKKETGSIGSELIIREGRKCVNRNPVPHAGDSVSRRGHSAPPQTPLQASDTRYNGIGYTVGLELFRARRPDLLCFLSAIRRGPCLGPYDTIPVFLPMQRDWSH
jgi:hypothetical protein